MKRKREARVVMRCLSGTEGDCSGECVCRPNVLVHLITTFLYLRSTLNPFFFLFKQQTAYELSTCLEFRRVLFRSRARLLPELRMALEGKVVLVTGGSR